MTYKLIQLTNLASTPFGAVATGALVPLGTETAKINCGCNNQPNLTVSTNGANTVNINSNCACRVGTYKITYNASVVATAAELVTLNLLQNGVIVATASGTAAAAGDTVNLSFTYILRNFVTYTNGFNTGTTTLQISNTGGALTSGTSNLIVEQVC